MLSKNKIIILLTIILILSFSGKVQSEVLGSYIKEIVKNESPIEVKKVVDIPQKDLIIDDPMPLYPKEILDTNYIGEVIVVADINSNGVLNDANTLVSSEIDIMNSNSVNKVKNDWEFKEHNHPYKIFIKFNYKLDLLEEPVVRKEIIDYDELEYLLIKAVKYSDHPEVLEVLIDAGAYVNIVDEQGRTPLMIAVNNRRNIEMIKVLLKKGARVNTWDKEKVTPLMYAVINNDNRIIELLIKHGAYLNIEGAKNKTLAYAVKNNGEVDSIETLLDYGAKVNEEDKYGQIPLEYAVDNKNIEMITLLIKYGANVNFRTENNRTIFMKALNLIEEISTIEMFIENGTEINARDEDGLTSLMIASANNENVNIIELLLQKEISINTRCKNGRTAISYSVYNENPDIIRKLIEVGGNVNIKNNGEVTPLMEAVIFGKKKVVEILLQAGARVNVKERSGKTPLMLAITDRYLYVDIETRTDVAKMLMDYNADIYLEDQNGRTAFMYAVNNKNPDLQLVNILLDKGVNINKEDIDGITPLMQAAISTASPEVIDLLLNEGADGTLKSHEEKTAFDYIERNPNIGEESEVFWRLNDAQYE